MTYSTKKFRDVPADDLGGVVGPDGIDDGRQRFLRVAESAFVVRIVARPHHLVDANLIDQLQAQRVDHERRAHVGVPVVPYVVLRRPVEHVLVRRHQVLSVLQCPRYPGDSALEPADPQTRVVIENPGEEIFGELFAESVDVDHHADDDAVELTGRFRRGLSDVVRHRETGGFDLIPDRPHAVAAVVDHVAVIVLTRIQWQQECLEAERLQFCQCSFGACGIPPVDQARAVEMASCLLLQLRHVLVVDAERPLAEFFVRVMEERQNRIGEGEFLIDAVLTQLLNAGLDVGARRAGEVVILHQHGTEITGQERLTFTPDLVGAVFVPDPRRLVFELFREAVVEDVVGQRNVVVRRENHRSLRQAHVGVFGVTVPILGGTESPGRVQRQCACSRRHQWPSNRTNTSSTVVRPDRLARFLTRSPAVRRRRRRVGHA